MIFFRRRFAVGSFALALFMLALAASSPRRSIAQDSLRLRPIQRALALAVAKVCANESGFDSPRDCALIWQVVTAHHDRDALRLAWLRAHSRRVLGDRACRRGNCEWTPHLTRRAVEPRGWPDGARWRPSAWRGLVTRADELVGGAPYTPPCDGTPITWGGRMDHRGAVARGLVALSCDGTRNTGYAYARRGR